MINSLDDYKKKNQRNNTGKTSMALTREIKQQVVILENTMIKDYRFMS